MESLLKKLQITQGPWEAEYIEDDEHRINATRPTGQIGTIAECYSKENSLVFAAAPEMLEALIEIANTNYQYYMSGEIDFEDMENEVKIIEKATNKSWEEIKELINE